MKRGMEWNGISNTRCTATEKCCVCGVRHGWRDHRIQYSISSRDHRWTGLGIHWSGSNNTHVQLERVSLTGGQCIVWMETACDVNPIRVRVGMDKRGRAKAQENQSSGWLNHSS